MSLRFDGRSGLIVVPTKIHGANGYTIVRLALDTGATMTMVNWDVLVLLGYDPAAIPERTQVTTGSGVEFVPRIELLKVEALGQTLERFSTLPHIASQRHCGWSLGSGLLPWIPIDCGFSSWIRECRLKDVVRESGRWLPRRRGNDPPRPSPR